jgi:uncharacterized repeat protein (TIGR01451 family)
MSRRPSPSPFRRLCVTGLATLALVGASMGVDAVALSGSAGATPPASDTSTYSVGTPQLATITDGTSQAPWNTSQGDPGTTAYPSSDLLPTYTPGGPSTGSGSTAEPNIAVYAGASSGTTAGNSPYPSGVVGTPGPLDGYCGTGNNTTESAGTPARQPTGTTLPLAPAYFPHVVRNADGSLTGYFDYRPKDADEAIVAAKSTDGGKSWTYEGEALEQNPGYCPTADTNDDGQGHPNVITVGGTSYLYTLPRQAGDNLGVGLLVHALTPTASNPLAGLPADEATGVDPDAFATAGTTVPTTGGTPATITVNQTGQANTLEQLVAGPFVDLTQTPTPTASSIITCTGVGSTTLTGCTTANSSGITVNSGDLIEQVIGTVNTAGTIPKGPNNTLGASGTKKNLNITFTSNLTATIMNVNAPNRVYVNGVTVYCPQSNASPTTALEYCTTGPQGSPLTMAVGAPVTADPIVPATAKQTTGLVAPDGIVGVLPSYPGAPTGSTVVMYTEKLLNYFVAGFTSASAGGTYSSTTGSSIQFFAAPTTSSALPTPSPTSPVTVEVADDTKKVVIPASCTGLTLGTGSINSGSNPLIDTLTGCTVPTADNGDTYTSNDQIGVPGAALESPTTLAKTGEGSTSQDKLYKNNEDLTVLRVAYTTDGINFSSAGLDNNGIISGQSNGASSYTDINNPTSTTDPPGGLNQYATPGTTDATEMRWVGSGGSIITNPDGTYGLFLSGAWSADGDSDAFNQIFYSSSTDGEHWTEPVSVVSTDYTFAASVAQDTALNNGVDAPLGISAYYSGRAYGPSVVQNPNGTLSMIFAGYRLPKGSGTAGTVLGTNSSAPYTVGATDPALYRNILEVTLNSSTSPTVPTSTTVTSSPLDPVAGQPVTYTATVAVQSPGTGTPTGSVSFSGAAGTLCSSAPLDLGTPDTATCTTTYTGGAQSDDVTASYAGDSNYASSSGSENLSIGSALSLTTTSPTSGYGKAGDAVDYDYAVTNNGPDTLTSVAVSDPAVADVSCPSTTLAGGASETCTGTYTVTQADVDAGSVTDTSSASALDGTAAVSSPSSSVTVDATSATSSLSLSDSSTTAGYGKAGDTVSYDDTVTNTGTTTLSDVAVTDPAIADVSCPDATLAPGASETCTGTYTVTQADVDAGSVTDTATATAQSPSATTITSTPSSVTVDATSATSSLALVKSTSSSGYSAAGQVLDFSYQVTNIGTTTISAVSVTDNKVAQVSCPDATLAPGASETCTGTYTVTQADVDAGSVTNTATAAGQNPQGGTVTSAASSVTVDTSGATTAITVVTTSTSTSYRSAGTVLAYRYLVTNTGTTTLDDVSVSDAGVLGVSCPTTTLAPGASETCTGSHTVTGADVTAGSVTDTSVADALSPSSATVTSSPFTLTIDEAPSFTSASSAKATAGVPFTFTIATTGGPDKPVVSTSSTLPGGLTLVANGDGTATLSGTPVCGTSGNVPLSLTATNGAGVATQTLTLAFGSGSRPTFTSASSATATAGEPFSFTVSSSCNPTPSFTSSKLPKGLTLVDNHNGTATLSGTPTSAEVGLHTVTLTAASAFGNTTQSLALGVDGPVSFTSKKTTATATIGVAFDFTVTTAGYPSPTFTTTAKLPSGISLVNQGGDGNASLVGTPKAGSAGTYTIPITASNGVGTAVTQTITLTVEQFPTITAPSTATTAVGDSLAIDIGYAGYPTPTLKAKGLPKGITLVPNGAGQAVISGIPSSKDVGTYSVTITASSKAGTATHALTLTVNA